MNFLELTNAVCQRMGEVELTASEFPDVIGAHAQIKQAVNASLSSVNMKLFELPFGFQTITLTLTVGGGTYYPTDESPKVNFESFLLSGGNVRTSNLEVLDYEEFLGRYAHTLEAGEQYRGTPRYVYQRPDGGFGVHPAPDKAYTLKYDYYPVPVKLRLFSDEMIYPESFEEAIINGATAYSYMFRGDPDSAYALRKMFEEDLKTLRSLYQNRYEYVRSGYRP